MVAEQLMALAFWDTDKYFQSVADALDPQDMSDAELQALYRQAILYYSEHHQLDSNAFTSHLAKELPLLGKRFAKILLIGEHDFTDADARDLQNELASGIRYLKRQRVTGELRDIERRLTEVEGSGSTAEADTLLQRMNELTEQLRNLDG
jgi:hypothetical protein